MFDSLCISAGASVKRIFSMVACSEDTSRPSLVGVLVRGLRLGACDLWGLGVGVGFS